MPLGAASGPEIELAEHDLLGCAVRAASIRGLSHRHRGTERQDAFLCSWDPERRALLVAVADGVGSKKRSREASTTAVAVAVEAWKRGNTDLSQVFREVNDHLAEAVPRNEDGYRVGATTLTLAEIPIEGGSLGEVTIAWVGDTPVWILSNGTWAEVTPQDDAADGFAAPISALPATNLEVLHATAPASSEAIFVMTDGVGNAIRNSTEARASLAEWWAEPPGIYTFGAQVEFARKGSVDDRTVVGVWPEISRAPGSAAAVKDEPSGADSSASGQPGAQEGASAADGTG